MQHFVDSFLAQSSLAAPSEKLWSPLAAYQAVQKTPAGQIRTSLLRHLFLDIAARSRMVSLCAIGLVVAAAIVRLALFPSSRYFWGASLALPVVSVAIALSPLSAPGLLLVVEALLTAHLLVTTEAVLSK